MVEVGLAGGDAVDGVLGVGREAGLGGVEGELRGGARGEHGAALPAELRTQVDVAAVLGLEAVGEGAAEATVEDDDLPARARGGHDVVDDSLAARAHLGYLPEQVPLYPELRVHEYLAHRAELKGLPRRERRDAVATAIGQVTSPDTPSVAAPSFVAA